MSKQQQQRSNQRHLIALVGLTDVNWGRKRGEYPIHCDHRSPSSRRHSSCNRSGCNVDRFKTRNPTCKNLELKRAKRIIKLSPGGRCRTLYLVFILLMFVVQISVARARLRWGVIPTGESKSAHSQIIWRVKTQNDVYKETDHFTRNFRRTRAGFVEEEMWHMGLPQRLAYSALGCMDQALGQVLRRAMRPQCCLLRRQAKCMGGKLGRNASFA
jgi:hypothetical protein